MNILDLPASSPIFRERGILEILQGKSSDLPQHLNLDDAREIINASSFATEIKTPHLVNMTICWEMMPEFVLRDWMIHQLILFEKMRKWLARNDLPVAFIWLREMGRQHGAHTHILLHLPAEHWGRFRQFVLDAGEFVERDASGQAVVLSGNVYGTKTPAMRAGHLRYFMKSLDPTAVARAPAADGGTRLLMKALGVDDRGEARLPIVGKRCGTSHTLGRFGPACRWLARTENRRRNARGAAPMSGDGRTYTPEQRAEWERDNTLPLPVLRLDVLRYQRRAREIAAERARQVAERRAARETPSP